ncbi:MAG: dihydrodipicolinate synthase family protein [Acidimicrobiales bacterium]|jgi:dihydrodipicolinate synthase/N-acetylneuraminate lyase
MTAAEGPRRAITGMTAVLLPYHVDGTIDWDGFESLLARTVTAGLIPAVNMDTGYGPSLGPDEREEVLSRTRQLVEGTFVAGALVDDGPGATFDAAATAAAIELVAEAGGLPIVFPSYGLAAVPEEELPGVYAGFSDACDRFLGFELGSMFHPAGRIWTLDTYASMLEIPALVGAKHSSLSRRLELDRLAVRDGRRPGFMVLTGNDLAIDLVTEGSDYLLGLSTFAPDAFAARDAAWTAGDDVAFLEFNDLLQYLGQFSFRRPVPAYRHDAAIFLELRSWITAGATHPDSPQRPASDREVLADIVERLEALLD